ncbi:MAG TPA: ComEC/Rec2 family competence protein [Edaphocola sp.]|nr:ComEC/Rec2 family competence protein [Edaphocola sp.]
MLHKIPILPFFVCYVLGIITQVSLLQSYKLQQYWWFVIFGLVILIFIFWFLNRKIALASKFTLGIEYFTFFLLGIFLTRQNDIRNNKFWLGNFIENGSAFLIEGIADSEIKPKTIYFPAKCYAVLIDGQWQRCKSETKVYVYKNDSLNHFNVGERWIVTAKPVPIRHNNNPGSFNYAQKLQRDGIYYQFFVGHQQLYALKSKAKEKRINSLRKQLLLQLDTYISEPVTRALTQATLLNESGDMDAKMRADYAHTGISHIIAISGMHVNILFAIMLLPLFWWKNKKYLWLKYLIVLPFVWIYVALCLFPPSVVRAAVGFSLVTITLLVKRPQSNFNLLCINAFGLLLFNPIWLFHIGVQLSFLAVLSILIFYKPIQSWVTTKNLILKKAWDTIAISLSVQVLVFPLVIYYFHQFPFWFLVANFFAAIFSFLLIAIAVLIMIFGVLKIAVISTFFGKLLIALTAVFNKIIAFLNQYTPDLSKMIPLDIIDFCLIMIAIISFSFFWLKRTPISFFIGSVFTLGFMVNLILQELNANKQNRIIVYTGVKGTLVDRVKGKRSIVYADSADSKVLEYVINPSAIVQRIKKAEVVHAKNKLMQIGNKNIAFLTNPDSIPNEKIDFLILSGNAILPANFILSEMNPQKVILDGSFGRNKALKYENELLQSGIKVHNVSEDGAWWYNFR